MHTLVVAFQMTARRLNAAPRMLRDGLAFGASVLVCGCAIETSTPVEASPPSSHDAPASNPNAVANFAGPFEIREALTFYVVNDAGGDFALDVRFRCPRQVSMDRPVLVRVFDPDERLIARHDDPGEKAGPPVPERECKTQVNASGKGVYQVVVTGFDGSVDLETDPKLPWGVFGYPGLVGRGSQFENAYVFLPPGLDVLRVSCDGAIESLKFFDEQGAERLVITSAARGGTTQLPASKPDVVWRLSAKGKADGSEYEINFGGMPIILCPDESTARAVHASVDVLDDGTICFHKFQARAHALLKKYRSMDASAFAVSPPILVRQKNSWLKEPIRNQLLLANFGVFATLPEALAEQNLDPRSPWFGSVFVWRDEKGEPRRDNPWATYTRGGLVQAGEHASVFAAVHNAGAPFNPLHNSQALRNRVIIAALQDLMMLREHEDPHTEFPHHQGGNRAFLFSRYTRSFAMVAADCPEEVRQVWTEGLRRYVDAQSITSVANTVNQWSAIWIGFEDFYQASKDEAYRQVLKRHLGWLATRNQWNLGYESAGYFDEAEGPDATYTGITTFHLALLYHTTRDAGVLEILRRSIDLLNHTLAPEPNGQFLGASSFCHRTPGDWTQAQMGGGLVMLADDLPEAAVHAGHSWMFAKPAKTPAELHDAERELVSGLRSIEPNAFRLAHVGPERIQYGYSMLYPIWENYPKTILPGALPMAPGKSFTRNFGDEFFCVRRPTYYAFVYAGHTMGEWQKQWRAKDPRTQHPRNGGGLGMFWSPGMGSSILAKNWSAYAAHSLITESDVDGKVEGDWEDYWSIKNEFNSEKATAKISGLIRDQPLRFEKRYQFLDDRIRCELTLDADKPCQFRNVWECFPYPLDKPEQLRVRLLDENGHPVNKRPASAIAFETSSNEVHLIVFDQARMCDCGADYGTDAYNARRDHGRVLTALPNQWQAGQSRSFGWSMMAVPRDKIAQAIRQALSQPAN